MLSINEFIDIIIMVLGTGYIFLPEKNWETFKTLLLVTGPAVVLHELMHKFVAILLGLQATIHASIPGLILGVILRAVNSPFVLFVPGYAAISGPMLPVQSLLVSFAGPATNGILYLISSHLLKKSMFNRTLHKHYVLLMLTKKINGFLFVFNMLPVPPFDGGHVISAIIQMFG